MTTKILNLIILLIVPFLMIGVIKKTKAFWGGRKGVSIWQPLYDFIKLLKKDFVISKTTTFVFRLAPIITITSIFAASLFVPMALDSALINIPAGFILFAYILGLGKFFALISAMDTGSSFEGMGASREACFTSIVEPAFFMIMASIMALTGTFTFDALSEVINKAGSYGTIITIFAVAALFLMILIEGSRVPVDDPTTHLELTMIHEVMILDNSGKDLALLTWGNAIKMFLISSLIANLLIPQNLNVIESVIMYLSIILLISLAIGTLESGMARIRMTHVFEFVFIMSSIALIILSLVAAKMFGG